MLIPFLIIGLFVGINVVTAPPDLHTPQALAEWAKCDPAYISYWIDQRIKYAEQSEWLSAETVMRLGRGDCKGVAAIATESLSRCVSVDARTVILARRNGEPVHASTLFTNQHTGRRGYINGGQYDTFPVGASWETVIDTIPGGPWSEAK